MDEKLIRGVMPKNSTEAEFRLFMNQIERTQLDPLARQIYALPRKGGVSIQVSIDGFRLIAERTGKYEGQAGPFWCGEDGVWKDVWVHKKPPAAAKVGVWKAGAREPTWGVARYEAYASGTDIWRTMPDVMVAKCAEALALRKAFPNELSGLYTGDEMAQAGLPDEVDEKPRVQAQTVVQPTAIELHPKGEVDPATGEMKPFTINMTTEAPNPHGTWVAFGQQLIAAFETAYSEPVLDQWIELNERAIEAMQRDVPKVHKRLMEVVGRKREKLSAQITEEREVAEKREQALAAGVDPEEVDAAHPIQIAPNARDRANAASADPETGEIPKKVMLPYLDSEATLRGLSKNMNSVTTEQAFAEWKRRAAPAITVMAPDHVEQLNELIAKKEKSLND